jgi:hypothetical protein
MIRERVYIAGPMTGVADENFPAFFAAEKFLTDKGFDVFNPASLGHSSPERDRKWFMQRDNPELLRCDAIALLPGWWGSAGARNELDTAKLAGLRVIDATTGEPFYESVNAEAHRITNRDRRDVYGHPMSDFTRIGQMWSGVFGHEVTPEQVGLCMVLVKVGRLCQSPGHRDSIVDICGYGATLDMIRQWRETHDVRAVSGGS